jgi:hypothetical protein
LRVSPDDEEAPHRGRRAARNRVPGATPAIGSADIGSELRAGNKAEQRLQRSYRGYTVVAVCDQEGSRRFWCSASGYRGDCFVSGHARVTRYPWHLRLVGVNRSCF